MQIAEQLGLGQPHAVGPDVGTGALLFAAARHPEAFRSLVVGAGAATFPLHVDGALKDFIDAPSVDDFGGPIRRDRPRRDQLDPRLRRA